MSDYLRQKIRDLEKLTKKHTGQLQIQEKLINKLIESVKDDFREVIRNVVMEEIQMDVTVKSNDEQIKELLNDS